MSNRIIYNSNNRLYYGDNNFNVQKGLVGHWPLNSTDGATDLIGGNDGTLNGGMGYSSGGGRRYAVFDSSDDYVSVPHSADLNVGNGSITVSFWCYRSSGGALQDVLNKLGSNTVFRVRFNADNKIYTELYYDGSNYITATSSVITAPITTWFHLASTFNYATWTASSMYVDGALVACADAITGTTKDCRQSYDINIGRNSAGVNYFPGNINDVRIYNRALSAAEIARLAQIIY